MSLNIFQFFQPKSKIFFLLFEKASANLIDISKALVDMVSATSPDQKKALIREIERLEHVGDEITHETFRELSSNFITPFDREDIHSLISAFDDVVDYIHGSSKRIDLYKVETITPSIVKLSELIYDSSLELQKAITELKDMKNKGRIKESCVRINSIENHADDIFDTAIAKLFDEEKDSIEIIKMKEVLQGLETATDMCENAANTIESILVKNA